MRRNKLPSLSGNLSFFVMVLYVTALLATLSITLLVLNARLQREDRGELANRLRILVENYNLGGLQAVRFEIEVNSILGRERPFFVRVADRYNRTLVRSIPRRWNGLPFEILDERNPDEMPHIFRIQIPESGSAIEIATEVTDEDLVFQVGASDRGRRALLASTVVSFAAVAIPAILLSTVLLMLRIRRSIKPIERLVGSVRETIDDRDYTRTLPNDSRTRETAELTDVLNTLLGTVDDLVRDLRSSLDSLAHDIRTPLTRIRTVAELAISDSEPAGRNREQALETVLEEINGIQELADRFLEASGKGMAESTRRRVALATLTDEIVPAYRYVGEERGVRIVDEVPDSLIVDAYPERLRQALANLLDNAVKYGPPDSTVEVRARRIDSRTRIEVVDQGPHLEATHLWEYRTRGSREGNQPGHGVGLALVRTIATAHNGTAYYQRLKEGLNAFVIEIHDKTEDR